MLGRERDEFTHCPSHSGAGIEAALANEVGTRFAMEKLRGNDFWGGAIGAATRPQRKEIDMEYQAWSRILKYDASVRFPLGPPCRARLDLVSSSPQRGIFKQPVDIT